MQLCPAYHSGLTLEKNIADFKSGELRDLCMSALYSFYDVRILFMA